MTTALCSNRLSDDSNRLSKALADQFLGSPICTLSLSSKELFHSNFLGWLLKRNETGFASSLFDNPDIQIEGVHREKHNYDLTVETKEHGTIIIENKVKSIPDAAQIRKYLDRLKRDVARPTKFALLSLAPPSEQIKTAFENDGIQYIGYDKLLQAVQQTGTTDPYVRFLLDDYALLVRTLLSVCSEAKITDSDKLSFESEVVRRLKEIRLWDIAQKIRFCYLEARCSAELAAFDGFERQAAEVGLTNAQALLTYKWKVSDRFVVGVQIQGGQYRRFVESLNKKEDVKEVAEAVADSGLWIYGDNKNGKLLKFGSTFKYRYTRISDERVDDIIRMLRTDFKKLRENSDKIREILK